MADHRLRESPPGHARVDKYIAPERRGSGRGNNGFGAEQEQIEKVPEKDARRGFQLEQQFELSTWVRSHSFRRGAFGFDAPHAVPIIFALEVAQNTDLVIAAIGRAPRPGKLMEASTH